MISCTCVVTGQFNCFDNDRGDICKAPVAEEEFLMFRLIDHRDEKEAIGSGNESRN